jgi:hypothetical protein
MAIGLAAGVFTLWASSFVVAATSAPIVYPGCASPPTRFNHVWYFDPVNGKTVAQYAAMNPPIPMPANGSGPTSKTQGSQQHPWNDLSALAWSNNNVKAGYKYPLLSTVPTNQYVAGVGYRFLLGSSPGAVQQAGPIGPGTSVRLRTGGAVTSTVRLRRSRRRRANRKARQLLPSFSEAADASDPDQSRVRRAGSNAGKNTGDMSMASSCFFSAW